MNFTARLVAKRDYGWPALFLVALLVSACSTSRVEPSGTHPTDPGESASATGTVESRGGTPAAPTEGPARSSGTDAAQASAAEAVDPDTAQLPGTGPYFVYRSSPASAGREAGAASSGSGSSPANDLALRHADGSMAATWRIPGGGTVPRLSDAVSPDGRWLAFVSGDLPDYYLTAPITTPLKLHVWDLAGGRESFAQEIVHPGIREDLRRQAEASATAADWLAAERALGGGERSDATSVLLQQASLVTDAFRIGIGATKWSPDGRHLAVVGALDGPSSDVYLLDVDGWQLRRASDEPTHVIRLAWSPDGRWVLHEGTLAASEASGSADPDRTDVVSVDGSASRQVWMGSGIGSWGDNYSPDGWLGDHDAIMHYESNGCGVCDMVRIDASTGATQTLVASMGAENFVVDPVSHTAAVAGDIYDSDAKDAKNVVSGVQLVDLDQPVTEATPVPVHDLRCRVALWGAEGLPFVWLPTHVTDGCIATAFGPNGRTLPVESRSTKDRVSISPKGAWRVVYGENGWRLYDEISRFRGHASGEDVGDVKAVTWRPDESALVWLASGNLWMADLPDGRPQLVGPWPGSENPGLPGYWDFDVTWLSPR